MRNNWWKILSLILIIYSIIMGFKGNVPQPEIGNLDETIRNLYFHVPMWFTMIGLLTASLANSIKYLSGFNLSYDIKADEQAKTAMVFGVFGLLTGMVWARFTWGDWWANDVKLNGAAIAVLSYLAYFVLRNSINEQQQRARIAAVYNIIAYVLMIVFVFVLPRVTDSLHPGNGGNPAFSLYDNGDLNSNMRMVFYPAVAGWVLMGFWIANIRKRIRFIEKEAQA